jgi:hypothetical protein
MSNEEYYCIICGKLMQSTTENAVCSYCKKEEKADYVCPNGHYVCEECRLASGEQLILKTCKASVEVDPIKLAILLMKHPAIPMHGPEHHYLVGCSILSALKNSKKFEIKDKDLEGFLRRVKKFPYGSCGLLGVCGAAGGAGTAISIATKATMMSDKERSLAMEVVSESLKEISKIGGPRCCKASTFAAIKTTVKLLNEKLGIEIPIHNPNPCEFSKKNPECLGKKCPYFSEGS